MRSTNEASANEFIRIEEGRSQVGPHRDHLYHKLQFHNMDWLLNQYRSEYWA